MGRTINGKKHLPMDILNKYESGIGPVQKTSTDLIFPALNEVIDEIDREARLITTPGSKENKEDEKIADGIKSPSHQYIQFSLASTFCTPLRLSLILLIISVFLILDGIAILFSLQ